MILGSIKERVVAAATHPICLPRSPFTSLITSAHVAALALVCYQRDITDRVSRFQYKLLLVIRRIGEPDSEQRK